MELKEKISSLYLIVKKIIPTLNYRNVLYYFLTKGITYYIRPIKTYFKPYFLQLEVTNKCNFRCSHCLRWSSTIEENYFPINKFKTILEQLPHLSAILFQGLGEPFLHPKLFKFVEQAKRYNIFTAICTNGSLLKEKVTEIIDSGLDYLAISVDAIGENGESLRKGSIWEDIEEGLKILNNYRLKVKRPILALWITVSKQNIDELHNIGIWACRRKVEHIHLQALQWKHEVKLKKLSLSLPEAKASIGRIKLSVKDMLNPPIITHDPFIIPHKLTNCNWPWEMIYIDVLGNVKPCCVTVGDEEIMGNIFKEPFDKIWNNENYLKFRYSLIKGELPIPCKNCYFL